jgi:RNase P subunit RPR2
MKENKPKAHKNFLTRFTNLFKDTCPDCGTILKRSTVSVRNKKGKVVPMKICHTCGYKKS